jgi:type IV secretory pathway VirB10-like protein
MKPGAVVGLLVLGAVAIGAVAFYLWPTGGPATAPTAQQPAPAVATRATPPVAQPAPPAPAKAPTAGPDFDVVRVRPDGQTVIAGRAEPGASVTVLDGATAVATVIGICSASWTEAPRH